MRKKLKSSGPIVITHGTDTMVETGLLLQKSLRRLKVPVILTGAMTPLGFEGSDGLQNLTESLFATRILPPGVHLVMHNQAFPIHRVRKDRRLARFVWKGDTAKQGKRQKARVRNEPWKGGASHPRHRG